MDEQDIEYFRRKLVIAKAKSDIAIAEMDNEAMMASKAIKGLSEAIMDAIINWQKDIYCAWITLPDRKDNLN